MATARISALVAALALVLLPAAADARTAKVSVMSRNLYLGADLTPGTTAKSIQELVNAAGGVLNQVDANNFPVRAKGLAQEILTTNPDLVGLQEAALWRTQPCSKGPLPPSATTVRYDYLRSLLRELNATKKLYRLAAVKNEFDFEVWANTDGDAQKGAPGCPFGSEINGRLTMRDAILVRNGVKTTHARTGTFTTLLQVKPGGVGVNVTRGWTALDATVRGKTFHFVNTHLEAFDSNPSNSTNTKENVGNGEVRAAQAKQLIANGGAARSKLPVILVGDLNSDVKTEVKKGDGLADRALLSVGFVERSTDNPLGCCLNSALLTTDGGGQPSDFDHRVDHVMTNKPRKVKLLSSTVTGLAPVNGFWDSDHAGLLSVLKLS